MKPVALTVLLVLALSALAYAADTQPASKPALPPGPPPELLAIRYERTGGFVGTDDVIEITPAGAVAVQGRLMGNVKGQLTVEQVAKLAPLFAGWASLKPSYPAPAGSADGFQIKIRYGTTEVTASDMNTALPANFKAVRDELEKIVTDLKK